MLCQRLRPHAPRAQPSASAPSGTCLIWPIVNAVEAVGAQAQQHSALDVHERLHRQRRISTCTAEGDGSAAVTAYVLHCTR
jgi:hypothetical protein